MKIKIDDYKMDLIDLFLTVALFISIIVISFLIENNQKLLVQVDESMGQYNELKNEYNLCLDANEELKKEYETLIEIIRASDRYQMPEEMEEN